MRREKAEKIRKKREEADKKWNRRVGEISSDEFKDFFNEEFKENVYWDSEILSYLKKMKEKYFDREDEFWYRFDSWKIKKDRQKKLIDGVDILYDDIVRDFQTAPYTDKISSTNFGSSTKITYRFESRRIIEITLKSSDIIFNNVDGYILTMGGMLLRYKWVSLINILLSKGRTRSGYSSNTGNYNAYSKKIILLIRLRKINIVDMNF